MAFGGALVAIPAPPAGEGPQQFNMQLLGLTLAARAGAPDITAADTGELVTAAPVANQTAIPTTFGKGRGNWVDGDQHLVRAYVASMADTAQGVAGETPLPHVVPQTNLPVAFVAGGNLSVIIHNRGAQATGALQIVLEYCQSLVR